MTKEELISIIDTFTKEDWLAFDSMRINKFKPDESEVTLQAESLNKQKMESVKQKLIRIWFIYPDVLTKEFVLQFLTAINAGEFVWEDLNWWVDAQIELFGSLDTAFIELVYNKL